jgi:hypothetical protein
MVNEFQFNSGAMGPLKTKLESWRTGVTSAGYTITGTPLNHVVPRFTYAYTNDPAHHKYTKTRTGLNGAPLVVQDYLPQVNVGSQRRRLKP